MPINNSWIKAGALIAAIAVLLGGFNLQSFGDAIGGGATDAIDHQAEFVLAVIFHLLHALAIVIVGVLIVFRPSRILQATAWCFAIGILLFSGSTYLVSMTNLELSPLIKLAGTVLLVVAWIMLVEGACPGWNKTSTSEASSDSAKTN